MSLNYRPTSYTPLDYRAGGTLIAHAPMDHYGNHDGNDRPFLVLVYTGGAVQPCCVAKYIEGSDERLSGEYFSNLHIALCRFCEKLVDDLGVYAIHGRY